MRQFSLSLFRNEFFPFRCGGEGFQILKSVAVQGFICGPDDTAEVDQGLLIHLILAEQFHVVAEIAQEPIELPEGAFGRVEPAGEAALERLGFEHNESEAGKPFGMPAIGGPFDANQEQSFEQPRHRWANEDLGYGVSLLHLHRT